MKGQCYILTKIDNKYGYESAFSSDNAAAKITKCGLIEDLVYSLVNFQGKYCFFLRTHSNTNEFLKWAHAAASH
jgi:hypothetical protein